ncbi:MAG: Unknown protein [uncultured Sulfurovum sp.]|uniref:Cytochrome c domain-containing protein n=1 Tax=uncultured Sulfurovum sp. TaxID=269237 RepID=A0A6S6TLK0_9BACT|nr:MAG: Unknown protein [uncultured Sulfurovum sp.]
MHKKTVLLILLTFTLGASANVYQSRCVPCHKYQPATLEKMFMLYLKTHSVELSFKLSLKEFLKKPTEEKSLIGNKFIERFSVKGASDLNDTQLDEAIDTYWDLYNPKDNLK